MQVKGRYEARVNSPFHVLFEHLKSFTRVVEAYCKFFVRTSDGFNPLLKRVTMDRLITRVTEMKGG